MTSTRRATYYTTMLMLGALTESAVAQQCNDQIWEQASFSSFNFPDRFIRHSSFLGWLSDPRETSQVSKDDATFDVMPGERCRAGYRSVVLRSRNYPTHYLRHTFWRVRLDRMQHDSPDILKKDASWEMVAGLAGTGLSGTCVSFRSVNFPDRYIRHRKFELWLDAPDGTDLFRRDATFCKQSPRAGYYDTTPGRVPGGQTTPQISASVIFQGINRVFRVTGSGFSAGKVVEIRGTLTSTDGLGNKTTAPVIFDTNAKSGGTVADEISAGCPFGYTSTYKVTARDTATGRTSNESGAGC